MKKYKIIFLLTVFCSCSQGDSQYITDKKLINIVDGSNPFKIQKIETITFEENIYNIDSFIISNAENKSIIYLDEQQGLVNKLNLETGDRQQIGNKGNGPFEYIMPSYLREYKSDIYVWDSSQLKFIIFDSGGNPVRESNILNRAVRKFDVVNHDSLVLKMSGGFTGESVGIYNFSAGEILDASLTGVQDSRDLLLEILSGTSGILAEYPLFYYSLPSKSNIYVVDLSSNEESVLIIDSPYFNVEEFTGDFRQFVNENREELIEFLLNNSAAMDLYKYHNLLIFKTINGTTEVHSMGQSDLLQNRYYIFYMIDEKNEYYGHFKIDYKPDVVKYSFFEDGLYELVFNEEVGTGQYVLNIYKIEANLNE